VAAAPTIGLNSGHTIDNRLALSRRTSAEPRLKPVTCGEKGGLFLMVFGHVNQVVRPKLKLH
jgi:hypothetical protein